MALSSDEDDSKSPGEEGASHPADGHANASTKQVARNFATGYVSLIATMALSLVVTPILLDRLGASQFGLWAVLGTVSGYVGLLDAGVGTAATQKIAAAVAVRDRQRVSDILVTCRAFYVLTGLMAVLVIAALTPFIASILNVDGSLADSTRIAFVIMGLSAALGFMTNTSRAALAGNGRSDRLNLVSVALILGTQLAEIAAVLVGGGVIALFSVVAAGAVVGQVFTVIVARRTGVLHTAGGRRSWPLFKEVFKLGGRSAVISLSGTVSYQLDTVIIGTIRPIGDVTPYELALTTSNLSSNVATAGTNTLMPNFAHSFTLQDRKRAVRLYRGAIMSSLGVALPVAIAVIAFGPELLDLWLGATNVPPATFAIVAALNILTVVQMPGHQSAIFLTGAARVGFLARWVLLTAIINFALSIVATKLLGPIGPVIGSIPVVIAFDFLVLPIYCCRLLGITYRGFVARTLAPLLIPTAVSTAAAVALKLLAAPPADVWAIACAVVVTLLGWVSSVVVLSRSDPALRDATIAVGRRIPGIRSLLPSGGGPRR